MSTSCSDNLSGSKTTDVNTAKERNKESSTLDLVSIENSIDEDSKQCIDTDNQSTTQPKIASENSEIQASILALESLLQVNSNLKNKDIATKPFTKPHTSERIASRNSKWEVDEKRGAQATVGPVLYANICLNLKETHPGNVISTVAIKIIFCRMAIKSCCYSILMA